MKKPVAFFKSFTSNFRVLTFSVLFVNTCPAQGIIAGDSVIKIEKNASDAFNKKIPSDSLIILSNDFAARGDYKKAYEGLLEYSKRNEINLNEQIRKVILFSMIPFVVAFAFLVFVFYRRKRESLIREREKELQHQLADVEMKALRAQINPHFIFNSLNSIHRFILVEKSKEAGEYLLKFANLIRLVLENSLNREVPLKDDLEALKLYIEMEQVRMNDGFDYTVEVDPSINIENVLVPPLIVQPFVENSIWHGLNNKKERGKLTLSITRKEHMLCYTVEDNGGADSVKEESLINTKKKKSLGMSLTRERLTILNRVKGSNADFTISDMMDSQHRITGKRVELFIPFEENF